MTLTWSKARIATSAALAVWAALFWYIIILDRLPLYLAARTTWLAPVGAITLTLAALGRLASARTSVPEPLSKKQSINLVTLALPALLIMALPPIALGSFAIERRGPSVSGGYVTVSGRQIGEGDLSLMDVFELSYDNELHRLADRAGTTSSFTGFVSREPDSAAGEFTLNRFIISCCPGDAISVQLRVVGAPPGQFEADDWVRVSGGIYPVGEQLVVDASEVIQVPRPAHPYLSGRN